MKNKYAPIRRMGGIFVFKYYCFSGKPWIM